MILTPLHAPNTRSLNQTLTTNVQHSLLALITWKIYHSHILNFQKHCVLNFYVSYEKFNRWKPAVYMMCTFQNNEICYMINGVYDKLFNLCEQERNNSDSCFPYYIFEN